MSTLWRTLGAGALALPMAFFMAGPAAADSHPGHHNWGNSHGTSSHCGCWGNQDSSSFEESGTFAGIGGAGTYETSAGSNSHSGSWSDDSGSFAGLGGAGVYDSDSDDSVWHNHDLDNVDDYHGDNLRAPKQAVKRAPVQPVKEVVAAPVADEVVATPVTDEVVAAPAVIEADEAPVRTREPVVEEAASPTSWDHGTAGRHPAKKVTEVYHDTDVDADEDGATSVGTVSSAGLDHALYATWQLAAGPEGASSEGVTAVAIPGSAAYHAWEVAAGVDGASTHDVASTATTGQRRR
jgi:hypothetical protein